MNQKLDSNFRNWLESISKVWDLSVSETASGLGVSKEGESEIIHRFEHYPKVSASLTTKPFDLKWFSKEVQDCWILSRQDKMSFNAFLGNENIAINTIHKLIDISKDTDQQASKRFDDFIEVLINSGYTFDGKKDYARAVVLGSLILTSLYPSRFVDFRTGRWKKLANTLDYKLPPKDASYGDWIVWSGKFANEICNTETFQEYYPLMEYKNPLWVIAGICWLGLSPERPPDNEIAFEDNPFPEGESKRKWHFYHERNRNLIKQVKEDAKKTNPLLKCEICGFSFVEKYGEHGCNFIEAHHKIPVAELNENSVTSKKDISLVCSNCHRMLHRGQRSLGQDELIAMLRD